MKRKAIGIHKGTNLTVALGFLLIVVVLITICGWGGYMMAFPMQVLYDHGYEVEAEIVSVRARTTWDSPPEDTYYLKYYYKSETGMEYFGQAKGGYGSQKKAEAQIGKKIIITIEPGGISHDVRKSELKKQDFQGRLITAILLTPPSIAVFWLMMYVFHKDRVDRKLRDLSWTNAKIIKVKGRGLYRLTLQYMDSKGNIVEKKAYRFFTKKNTEFLQSKETIKVRTDGKHVGIDEFRLVPTRHEKKKAKG